MTIASINDGIWLVADWTKGRSDCLQPLPGWFLDRLYAYGRWKVATGLYDKHRSERLNVPGESLFIVPQHTARGFNINLRKAGIEKTTPEGKVAFHALRTTFSTLFDEAVNRAADLLGLADLYANSMPKPQTMVVGQNTQRDEKPTVKSGNGKVGAPGFEPGAFGSQSRRATKLRYAPFCPWKGRTGNLPRNPPAVQRLFFQAAAKS